MSEFEPSAAPRQANGLPEAPFLLRQAREAAGLHIAALAAGLKVPVNKLEALEEGRYGELPDLTFARALAASACRQLKIDPASVLEQIPGAVRPQLGGATPPINAPFKPGNGSSGGTTAWLSRPMAWGIGLLLLAAIALAVLPQDWFSRWQAGSAPASETLVITPSMVTESVVPSVSDDAPSAAVTDNTATAATTTTAVALVDPAVAPTVATPALAATDGSGLLSIRAVNESWIEVLDGAGAKVMQRVLKPGETADFSTTPPYLVVVGRADAVQVTVRGQSFDLAHHTRNTVARFEVK